MTTLDHRPIRTALIPWVIALVTLVGWNAFFPEQVRTRKIDSPGEMELSQRVDEAQSKARISSPQVFLAHISTDSIRVSILSSGLVLMEKHGSWPVFRSQEGAIQGRAPPAGAIA
jgi:hypothetical protein